MPDGADHRGKGPAEPRRRIPVWDLPTRLFHWTLAFLFVVQWISGSLGKLDLHIRVGEAILTLIIFRIAWGLVGSRHSRFVDFLVAPRTALAHFRETLAVMRHGPSAARPQPHLGHTELGGYMIVLMLLLLLVQAGAGLFATDEIVTDGPLNHLVSSSVAKLLTSLHSLLATLLLILVLVHISAALFYLLRKRENLILPLITGRAMLPPQSTAHDTGFASPWLALALLVASAALVWGIISL